MGRFEDWNNRTISRAEWTRITVRVPARSDRSLLLARFRPWFSENGSGRCMLWHPSCTRNWALAFSDPADSVLFRLAFPDVPARFVPQPHAHDNYPVEGTPPDARR